MSTTPSNIDSHTDGSGNTHLKPWVKIVFNKPLLSAGTAFLILAILCGVLIFQRYQLAKEVQNKAVYENLNEVKNKLQKTITHSLAATKMLTFVIDSAGKVNEFYSIASQIIESGFDIDAIQMAPDGIIQYVYPLKGNERVIGYDVLKDSTRNKEAYKAIERKTIFFAGPIELKQGGTGIVGRLPVFRQGKFWGFSAVIIKWSTLLKTVGIDSLGKGGFQFQLAKTNPVSGVTDYFLPAFSNQKNSQSVSVEVPDGEWTLSASIENPPGSLGDIWLLTIAGVLLSLFGAVFVYRFASRPAKLNKLVIKKTAELKESEKRYRSVIERVSDAFVALDKDWNYTFINETAGEIFNRDPESLLGKNIWSAFPESIDQPFYQAYHRAMISQEYQFIEEFYPSLNKWFESHIYPSADGITIFFKDVTEVKEITTALQLKEEKYRSLIEQASDGIVISNLEGIILEVNNSIQQLLGFSNDELIGYHLTEFVPAEDLEETPLRFNELMRGNSLLYERRLVKKDGSFIDVEVNSKMASTHTLIGFIRDITERKKSQELIAKTKERFELVVEATNDAIWDHDFITNETWGNNKLYSLYGAQPGSLKINLELFMDRIHPGDRDGIAARLQQAIDAKAVSLSETFRFKTGDGTYRTFFDRSYIIYDGQGQPVKMLGAMQDIHEREETRIAILKSEEKFRNIIEQAADGIFMSDETAAFIDVNSAGCRMTGYTLEELLKISFLDLIPAEDLISNPVQIVHMQPGESVTNERRLTKKDGTIIDVEISAQKLPDGRYQSFARDITERKRAEAKLLQSEQKYKLLFYNNPQPMWMTTLPDFNIMDINESAIKQYGYSREEFLKLNLKDMRPADDVAHFISEITNINLTASNNRQWRHKKKDGTIIQVEVISHEIEYEGKKVWLSLPHDITEEHQAKKLLQKSYEEIRQLATNLQSIREDERTSIAREIHDELGQQLTGLKMDMHWLTRKISTADQEVLDKMKESINLINATITSVRKISTNLRPSILDDLGLQAALEWQGDEFYKRSGTRVKFINDTGEIAIKPEASTALFRIYQELLTNIARHANASRVEAVLHVDETNLLLTVNDDGVGFNLEGIQNKKTLGLLGIKERTLLLGGVYEITSELGQGTTTTVSIPIIHIKSK